MQNIEQEFTVGFFDSSETFSAYAKQNDTDRVLKIRIADEGQDYSPLLNDANLTVFVRGRLPCGTVPVEVEISRDNIDAANSSITVPIVAEMVEKAGTAVCDVAFKEQIGERHSLLSTAHFKLIISGNPNG